MEIIVLIEVRDYCLPCNERYCGNCIHANGAKVQ